MGGCVSSEPDRLDIYKTGIKHFSIYDAPPQLSGDVYTIEGGENTTTYTPKKGHTHTIIFLTGMGCTSTWQAEALMGENKAFPEHFKLVFVSAAPSKCEAVANMIIPNWFNPSTAEEVMLEVDLADSLDVIYKIVEEEAQVLNKDYSKVFLGGYSQGATTALVAMLSGPHTIGGFFGLSTSVHKFLIKSFSDKDPKDDKYSKIPFRIYNGGKDQLNDPDKTKEDIDKLKEICQLTNFQYEVEAARGHQIAKNELKKIYTWASVITAPSPVPAPPAETAPENPTGDKKEDEPKKVDNP